MEAAQFTNMLVSSHHTTWHNNLENHEFCIFKINLSKTWRELYLLFIYHMQPSLIYIFHNFESVHESPIQWVLGAFSI
jgi:hypothetical protein